MADRDLQFALREWRQHLAQPTVLAVLAGTGAILGLSGPFGTDRVLLLVPRIVYWCVVAGLTYSAGVIVEALLRRRLERRPQWQRIALGGLAIGFPVAAVVIGVNALVFGAFPGPGELPGQIATIVGIAVIVNGVLDFAGTRAGSAPSPMPGGLRPPILDRVALERRGRLVALSVEDHYVRVQTSAGEDLILMRLSDAIRETGATPGAQVHRSHWVAYGEVAAARRDGGRAILTMSTGAEIPVSRANVPLIRDAGLLPRG